MTTTSTAIKAQGATFKIATGTGSAVSITGVAVGYPTKITAAGFSNGDKVALAGLTGADAATLNVEAVVKYAKAGYFYVDVDTTGMTITTSGSPTATPVTYTRISNFKQFNGLNGTVSDIDTTHLDSAAKEFQAGLVDNGTFSCSVDRDTSDAGHLMAQGEPFAACYWDTLDGRVFSLRSTDEGLDVSAIASEYGGGGHAQAAGFKVPREHALAVA